MTTQSGLHTRQGFSARPHNGKGSLYPSLSGLADNSVLADQIICVAKKYLDWNCDPNDPNLLACMEEKKWQVIGLYQNQSWRSQQGALKTYGDNLFPAGYPNSNEPNPNWRAIFVWEVWWEATNCLGGVDGYEDVYLYKSARVYDGNYSMRVGTTFGGKTRVDKNPTPGSAFTRRRDTLSGGVGHAGIVIEVGQGNFTTIEANGDNGVPIERRTYTTADITMFSMQFLHIENTPVLNAAYPREDGYCCTPEKKEEKQIGPCTNAQKPAGDGWTPTDAVMFQAITGGGDPTINAQHYIGQGFSFSPEYCWMRHENPKNTTTTNDCSTYTCPNGYKKRTPTKPGEAVERIGRRDGTIIDAVTGEIRPLTQMDVCCEPITRTEKSPCPDVTIAKGGCTDAVRVTANTFIAKSVPHFAVLYKNRLMGADITGSKWTFQTVGPKNGEGIGSALALPAPKYTNVDGDAIPDTAYSGFGTFSDKNGNLIVICPEWQASRLNSLRGNDKHASLLGPFGFYQVNCPGYTGNGGVHAQAADANYIVGSSDVIDGMNPIRPTTNSNGLVDYKTDRYGNYVKDSTGLYTKNKWVDENLFKNGHKLPYDLIWTSIVSNDNDYTGLINQIEFNADKNLRGKLDKPILIILKSAPPPFNWLEFVKTVITIAASFAPMVGLPPQIFTNALGAISTIEAIADPKNSSAGNVLLNIVKLGGLVAAILPQDLRGNINDLIKSAGAEVLGPEGVAFLEAQNKIVGQYLSDGQKFLSAVENTVTQGASQAFVALGFKPNVANDLVGKFFKSATNATIASFTPGWYEFASDYAKNLGGNFDKGFQDGVKLLNSIENIKTVKEFGQYSRSGKFEQDIIAGATVLENTSFQNLMLSGLGGSVMASTPGITQIMALMMNDTPDIMPASVNKTTNDYGYLGEIASVLKVGNGFVGDAVDFDRLTLRSLALKVEGLKDKVTKFVLPPALTQEQQECWGKELNQCFGIEIIGNGFSFRKEVKTTDNPPPVTVPPCIRTVNGSFMYCPPVTCKTGLSDDYNPSANYQLRCTDWMWREGVPGSKERQEAASQILLNGEKVPGLDDKPGSGIYTRKYNGVLYQFGADDQGTLSPKYPAIDVATGKPITNLFGYLCEMVEVAPTPIISTPTKTLPTVTTPTATTPTAPAEQPCAVLYPARVSPGVPDKWYAQIAGQWVEIIDCCPTPGITPGKDCCDETQTKLNQMKLDIAKITELVGRNQAGEKCPDCDLSEIKRMIANIQFPPQKTYDDGALREEMRAGFAEIRAMVGQMKQYDVSKDLSEIKDLIKAIKIADTQAISSEVATLRRMIETLVGQKSVTLNRTDGGTSQPTDTTYFDSKWNELKELINSKNTVYQRDYSGELAQIQRDLDYFKTEFAKTKSTITKEISTTTSPEVKQDLSKLLTEQTDLFSKKIKELEVKLTKPCEECTEIAKLQSQMIEMKNLILAIKPGTNTTTIKEVPAQNTGEIDRLTKEIQNLRARFDEMDEAFTTQINTTTGKVQQDYKVEHDEQVDLYTTLIMRYETALKQLTNQQPDLKTPPKTPIYVNGECTNCPKVVESHTRTIYEYPPVQQPVFAPCDDC